MKLSIFVACSMATALFAMPVMGATTQNGYTIGSGLLGPTIVDGANHAGLGIGDLRANDTASGTGPYPWVASWENLWGIGDSVSLTGMAIPVRSPGAAGDSSNNTDNGTWTFTIYELSGGANPNVWDGTNNGETPLTTVDITFGDAGSGPAIIPYATFDSSVDFTATSTGIAIHFDSTSSIRTRWDDSADGVDGLNANRLNGTENGAGHQWTIAGTVTPIPEPSSWALGVLGAIGAGSLRRRS